nr:MAG TPA: hypothetical protein [Caudoviricetes sp.]
MFILSPRKTVNSPVKYRFVNMYSTGDLSKSKNCSIGYETYPIEH